MPHHTSSVFACTSELIAQNPLKGIMGLKGYYFLFSGDAAGKINANTINKIPLL